MLSTLGCSFLLWSEGKAENFSADFEIQLNEEELVDSSGFLKAEDKKGTITDGGVAVTSDGVGIVELELNNDGLFNSIGFLKAAV